MAESPPTPSRAERARANRARSAANASASFLARFEAEVDPDRTLPAEERRRRAKDARSAYFSNLAKRSHACSTCAADLVARTTAAQGLPEVVEDPAVLGMVAGIVRAVRALEVAG